jgi:hypothetical protein
MTRARIAAVGIDCPKMNPANESRIIAPRAAWIFLCIAIDDKILPMTSNRHGNVTSSNCHTRFAQGTRCDHAAVIARILSRKRAMLKSIFRFSLRLE